MKKIAGNPFLAISKQCGVRPYDMEEIVLDHTQMEEIPKQSLAPFPNLQNLFVPFNKLKVLNNLEDNPRIKAIDARSNQLTDIDLSKQLFIVELLLSDNDLKDLDMFCAKIAHLRDLDTLDLRGNRVSQEKGYRNRIISMFPRLKVLDGLDVAPNERNRHGRLLNRDMVNRKARSTSVAEYLKTKPKSVPDAVVERKAETIRRAREMRRNKEVDEETAIARRRKEEYEAAASIRQAPMPEEMDFLGKFMKAQETQRKARSERRGSTRMFLKAAKFRDLSEARPEEELLCQMNPRIPTKAMHRAVEHSIVYPTFTD